MKKIIANLVFILTLLLSNMVYASNIIFVDIENHWAKENIIKLAENNIVNGYGDNTFKPNDNISVAEFLKIIIQAGNYKLVRKGSNVWPDSYIQTAIDNNLIIENQFDNYNKKITRYEVIQIISKFIDLKDVKESKNIFDDLDENYKSNVLKLVRLNIINGYSDKTFRGNNNITRAEVATIINKAIQSKKEIISKKAYDIANRIDLSNYGANSNIGEYSKTRYEILDNKLMIYDDGRYSNNWGYIVSDRIIDIKKVNNIIRKLIKDDSYTLVTYVPSKYTINQLKITHGESEDNIHYGGFDFAFTYYEDKLYELSRISTYEKFSNECYLKIEVLKLWDDYSEYLKGNYIDEYKKEKLLEALKIEFGNSHTNQILKYMIEKNEAYISSIEKDKEHTERKIFGKYIIDFYQKENGIPTFYISKKN